jgi:virulence factor Mce-like protein
MKQRGTKLVATGVIAMLIASGCSFIGGGGGGTYHLVAYFPRAVSLFKSSQVKVLGLPAGQVDDIEVQGTQVKVTMSIDNDIKVPKDVTALIAPQSLIGERYIQLSPAWRQGQESAPNDMVISHTTVPVEPDEALAELKKFLDSLDPKGLGSLINNLSDDLKGQGSTLNHALDQVSQIVTTFADKDQELANIVDHFDRFTATLTTRESQLGEILTTFSQATQVLADERQGLENLLAGLADLSRDGLTLVAKHSSRLKTDLETLTRLAQSIDVNLDSIGQLLDSGPLLVKGIHGAYNAQLRAFNLRQNWGPVAEAVLAPVFGKLGISPPSVCPPVLQECGGIVGLSSSQATKIELSGPTTPVDDLLGLLRSPEVARRPAPSTTDRMADGIGAIGGFLRDAAAAMVGAS